MNAKSAFMNILASHNTEGYLWLFSPHFYQNPGHDMIAYITKVNDMYGEEKLGLSYMTWSAAANLLDPFLYFNFYSLYRYVRYGESNNSYPFFKMSENLSYLPAIRYVLSPFGPEYNFINYLTVYGRSVKAIARFGMLGDTAYYGLGAQGDIISFHDFLLGADFHTWRQPELLTSSFGNTVFGAYGAIKLDYRPFNFMSFNGHLGYKSSGYVLGEPISQGLICRLGLTANL